METQAMPKDRNGYVYQDKQGAWYARTTITDATGKRRNVKRRAKDKQDAKRTLKSILQQLEAEGSQSVDSSRLTFNDLADFYALHYCKPAEYVDGKRIVGLRDVYRAQSCLVRFRAHFGMRRLREITYRDIHAYYAMRLKENTHYNRPPTIATMNRELGILRRVFNIGMREGWLLKNPFSMGEPLISPSSERRRECILTFDEERRLLEVCGQMQEKSLRTLLICLLDTGARLSEILKHLRWRSVYFNSRMITLEAMTTKTLKARQVMMTERMFEVLGAFWEASYKLTEERVFSITERQARFAFVLACAAAEIKYGSPDGITFHSLRHTAATRLVKGQMPIQMVGRILGHSQPQTTYRYLSADAETTAQAAAILEAFQTQTAEAQTTTAPDLIN
ncbi:MAG: tyrosine-type recombinase/integrase [Pyrinomonadaceae bacterium]|jgi:integrase